MGRIILIGATKGGVGKTVSTYNLAYSLASMGKKVLAVDFDSQAKAKDILEGRKIDPTFYPVIYGADEGDDWTDPKVWKKANPSLDITVVYERGQFLIIGAALP